MDGEASGYQKGDVNFTEQESIPAYRTLGGRLVAGSRPSLRDNLTHQRAMLVQRIADIDKALALLDRNPDHEELINLLGRVNY